MNKQVNTEAIQLSDADILRLSSARPWMFGVLVERYQKVFFRKSMKVLHSREAAEDAVQETFLKIYKNGWQFSERPGASFSSWAYKILLNVCWTEIARERRHHAESFDFADLDTAGSISELDVAQSRDRSYIESILSRMPGGLSRFLRLYFLEDKSQKEIAYAEGLSEVAVRSRIHRAKQVFKNIALKMV